MKIYTTDQLIEYCKQYYWTRVITSLHVHHTWKPEHKDYNGSNGLQLQKAMRDYHYNTLGWQDIGQSLTLLPDGLWVTGRDFNIDPASITGWNKGAFAIEMVGNFDAGHDKFEGKQAEAMFKFCAFFTVFKVLNIDIDVKFHRDSPTAYKTCPGSGIDRALFMDTLKNQIKGGVIPMTVKEFQQKYGLVADGIAGPKTVAKLLEVVQQLENINTGIVKQYENLKIDLNNLMQKHK